MICASEMRFGMKAFNEETCWIRAIGTLHEMIGFSFSVENFVTSGTLFVVILFILSVLGSQKKVNSDSRFVSRGVVDVVIFVGEAISFVFSDSGFQKKDSSETDFVCGDTGDEMIFIGGAIQSFFTCCIGVSWEGTDVVMIFLVGKAFSVMTSWIGGEMIWHSMILFGSKADSFATGIFGILKWTLSAVFFGATCRGMTF